MSFPRYPDYKDSGVEWLGEVPGHWVLKKVKHVASFCGGGTPSRDNMAYWNGDIPWVSPKDMKAEEIQGAEECITEEGLANSTSNLIAPGALLMVVRSGILKHTIPIAINHVEVALNQDMKALTFQPDLCVSRFFLRWVQGLNDELLLIWAKQGATVESLEQEYLANTAIPLPPVPEQSAIAAFLDRETAKIDALVAEQERLIALLKEKRQAVISHAVTKGLDPSVPLKDSGIDWLGEVPAHWEVRPLSYGINFQEGPGILAVDFFEDGVPLVRVSGVQGRWVTLDGCNFLYPEKVKMRWEHFLLREGDLVISASASMGTISEVGPEAVGAVPYTGLIRLWPNDERVTRDFIRAIMASRYFFTQAEMFRAGATIQHFGPTHLRQMKIVLPPPAEQSAIVAYLDEQTAKFDTLTAEAQRAIELLKEHRSALISAAVTGKIDVRGLVPAPEAAA